MSKTKYASSKLTLSKEYNITYKLYMEYHPKHIVILLKYPYMVVERAHVLPVIHGRFIAYQ